MNESVGELTVAFQESFILLDWGFLNLCFCSSLLTCADFSLPACSLAWSKNDSRRILCCPFKTLSSTERLNHIWEIMTGHYNNLYSSVKVLLLEFVCPRLSSRHFLVIVGLSLELIVIPCLKKRKLGVTTVWKTWYITELLIVAHFSHGYMKSSGIQYDLGIIYQ